MKLYVDFIVEDTDRFRVEPSDNGKRAIVHVDSLGASPINPTLSLSPIQALSLIQALTGFLETNTNLAVLKRAATNGDAA